MKTVVFLFAGFGHRFGRGLLNTAPTSRSVVSVFTPPSADWPDIYDSAIYSTPQTPDEFLDDNFQVTIIESKHFYFVAKTSLIEFYRIVAGFSIESL